VRRRDLLLTSLAAVSAGRTARAQQQRTAPVRIGYLRHGDRETDPYRGIVAEGLAVFGYVDGRNVAIDHRYSAGRSDLLQRHLQEFATLPVDIILTSGTPAVTAAARITQSIPIVVGAIGDPVATSTVVSLARPGTNVTGSSIISAELARKRIELLHEALPSLRKIGLLGNPTNAAIPAQIEEALAGARVVGVAAASYPARPPDGLAAAFASMRNYRVDGVLILDDGTYVDHGQAIMSLAMAARLPTIAGLRPLSDFGALINYGPDTRTGFRRAGYFIDRILKGSPPGEIPFEVISRIDLVINVRTAKELGLSIPPTLLARAEEVIE